jgi:hypothetical protein
MIFETEKSYSKSFWSNFGKKKKVKCIGKYSDYENYPEYVMEYKQALG